MSCEGFGEFRCIEAGGPEPGVDCAGRGIIAAKTETTIAEYVPRSLTNTKNELRGQTAFEYDSESEQADVYRHLAKEIYNNKKYVPSPCNSEKLKVWAESRSDRLLEKKEEPIKAPQSKTSHAKAKAASSSGTS